MVSASTVNSTLLLLHFYQASFSAERNKAICIVWLCRNCGCAGTVLPFVFLFVLAVTKLFHISYLFLLLNQKITGACEVAHCLEYPPIASL